VGPYSRPIPEVARGSNLTPKRSQAGPWALRYDAYWPLQGCLGPYGGPKGGVGLLMNEVSI